jgi:hypothetical protein
MKRHRVLRIDFDTRPTLLGIVIEEHWEEHVKALHQQNRAQIIGALKEQFGIWRFDQKLANFIELGAKPFSVIAFHNEFLAQIRQSFVMECYYPALTGACALGERILNHLIVSLRDDFKSTPQYKRVYSRDSFDNWSLLIDVLSSWRVLTSEAASQFRGLWELRWRAIHFHPDTDRDARALALQSIRCLQDAVDAQFAAIGTQRWFISGTDGEAYLTSGACDEPFLRRVYVPNCAFVGPCHRLTRTVEGWNVSDETYPDVTVSDDEFWRRRAEFLARMAPAGEREQDHSPASPLARGTRVSLFHADP